MRATSPAGRLAPAPRRHRAGVVACAAPARRGTRSPHRRTWRRGRGLPNVTAQIGRVRRIGAQNLARFIAELDDLHVVHPIGCADNPHSVQQRGSGAAAGEGVQRRGAVKWLSGATSVRRVALQRRNSGSAARQLCRAAGAVQRGSGPTTAHRRADATAPPRRTQRQLARAGTASGKA